MNLTIDIGNTCAKMALFADNKMVGDVARTDNATLADLPHLLQESPDIDRAIVSTVVKLTPEAREALSLLPSDTIYLDADTPLPIPPQYVFPREMGADRIAADVAAIIESKGRPVMVFDAGTCLTSELLLPDEGVVGGTISPGLRLRLISMHEHTSALPYVQTMHTHPHLLGTDTTTSMLSGAVNSITFEIEGYLRRLLPQHPDLQVYFTGGDTFLFDNSLKSRIIQDKFLLLRGLNYILEAQTHK